MFLKDDIYTSSGSLKLYHCWTDKVTKFDSSSFYNWEQDNLPVYDLDERTYYLWEQLGFPTSSIPGIALVVSADASDTDVTCNKNIFKSVSAAIQALPQNINFPVIIEVASFGQLGDLVLNNYKFGPRGSLEIINRNFARSDAYVSGNVGAALGGGNQTFTVNYLNADTAVTNLNSYASSVALTSTFESNGLGGTFSVRGHFLESSCLSISSTVFSGTTDARFKGSNLNGFISLYKGNSKFSRGTLITDDQNSRSPLNATSSIIDFKAHDLTNPPYDSITSHDVSTTDLLTGTSLYLNNYAANSGARGLFFNNKLSKLVINNCEGPIYIRNFYLDGGSFSKTGNLYGVEVNNSTNVYLENIVATRYRKAGLIFNNSNVKLLRGCVANRIYDFDSAGSRLTGPWASRINYTTYNSVSSYLNEDSAAGLIANNSTVTVSSTRIKEASLQSSYVTSKHSTLFNSFFPYINANYIFDFSKNSNGIILNNSILDGGDTDYSLISKHYEYQINFDIYNNVGYGIKSINSKISFDGRLNVFENLRGMSLDSSIFDTDKISFIYNQQVGLEANNSNITYNKNLAPYGSFERPFRPLMFSGNGQHLVLDNSKMYPVFTSGMDAIYDEIIFHQPIGRKDSTVSYQIIPSVEIKNSSDAILVSPYMYRDANHSVGNGTNISCKGSELAVINNSKVTLKGTRNYATRISGPAGRSYHNNLAGVYAGNNSTIEINGPTVIAQYGVDILADGRSSININPHKSLLDGTIDVSSFTLINKANHTSVELHSTRSCIVVDDNSTLNVKDLGSYKQNWTRSGQYTAISNSGLDYTNIITNFEPYVSGGSLQFYPNPIGTYTPGTFPGIDSVGNLTTNSFTTNDNPGLYYLIDQAATTNPFTYSSITAGGFCVRALNNSLINVHNVNFPCGWWQTSGPYQNNSIGIDSGGYCSKLFIWNLADNSQLKASYLSVSGLYPRSAGYYGPSGLWGGSGLPSSTPDTSTVSILDYFGAATTALNLFGKTTPQNYGPFRLYFSVNPVTYAMTYSSVSLTGTFGVIPQIYSQGYQPSGYLVCNPDVSNIYSIALQRITNNTVAASGYYYGSSMVDNNGYVRVFLDESAAETFANAKHCSVGKSGNAKLVSIHYPYTTKYGSSYGGTTLGIKSINVFDIERDN